MVIRMNKFMKINISKNNYYKYLFYILLLFNIFLLIFKYNFQNILVFFLYNQTNETLQSKLILDSINTEDCKCKVYINNIKINNIEIDIYNIDKISKTSDIILILLSKRQTAKAWVPTRINFFNEPDWRKGQTAK